MALTITSERLQTPLALVPNAVVSPLAGETFYVQTAALRAAYGPTGRAISKERMFPTIADALSACTSGNGDRIEVLQGYTETVSAADAWSNLGSKTNVTIHGNGYGTSKPTLTYSAAGATILMDQANFRIQNFNMFMAGDTASTTALTVAAPITVSAAGCAIQNCDINFGVDADQLVTIGVTTTAAADYFDFSWNNCFGATLAECTSFFYAVGADNLTMYNTRIQGATSSTTVGVMRFITTASTNIDVRNCTFQNMKAASIHAVTQMDGVLGTVTDCGFGILDNATLAGWVPASGGNGPQFFRCYTANLAAENGALMTPVSA